ncbi:MAG: glycosyltransferase family 87 protein [Candidatus Limnocylindria bacterium]
MDRDRLARLGTAALPVVAVLSFVAGVALTLAFAGATLGYDFLAYHQAVVRTLDGAPLYDMSFTETGGFGLFYYPPTFAPLILPLGLLSAAAATWAWIGGSLIAFLAGVAVLPVSRSVRWWVILLAGWSFPFVHALKLGQVGPVLFALFAVGWRWLDAPGPLGLSGALGAAIKIQPGLVLAWALLTRRWTAVLVGAFALALLAAASVALAGIGAWTDFLTLLRTVADPITTEKNLTPGAIAYRLGVPVATASLIQVASMAAAAAVVLVAIRWASAEASFLVVVVASQLVSPILWDHYAMLLLLPVAYLLAAGRWWAIVIPLVTAWPLVDVSPPIVYVVAMWLTMLATLWVGRSGPRSGPSTAASSAAPSAA